jgi:putative NADH-flavin reductase
VRLALFGARGRTGSRLLARALAAGHSVRALVTPPADLPPHPSLEVIAGDARDPSAVARAISGATAVLICLGMRDITTASTGFSEAVGCIVHAARSAGVRRIVAIASASVLPDPRGGLRIDHQGGGPYAHIGAEHRRNYQTLAGSGLDWTLMCPVDLKDDLPAGRVRWAYETLPEPAVETGCDDLAQTMLLLLEAPDAVGQRVGIVSDRSG